VIITRVACLDFGPTRHESGQQCRVHGALKRALVIYYSSLFHVGKLYSVQYILVYLSIF